MNRAEEACRLKGRPYFPIGTNLEMYEHRGHSFFRVVGHTKSGAPRLQELAVEREEIANDPLYGEWILHPQLDRFGDGTIHTTRWGKAYNAYLFFEKYENGWERRGYLAQYDPTQTYRDFYYG